MNSIYVSQNLYATMKDEHSIPAILESIKTKDLNILYLIV